MCLNWLGVACTASQKKRRREEERAALISLSHSLSLRSCSWRRREKAFSVIPLFLFLFSHFFSLCLSSLALLCCNCKYCYIQRREETNLPKKSNRFWSGIEEIEIEPLKIITQNITPSCPNPTANVLPSSSHPSSPPSPILFASPTLPNPPNRCSITRNRLGISKEGSWGSESWLRWTKAATPKTPYPLPYQPGRPKPLCRPDLFRYRSFRAKPLRNSRDPCRRKTRWSSLRAIRAWFRMLGTNRFGNMSILRGRAVITWRISGHHRPKLWSPCQLRISWVLVICAGRSFRDWIFSCTGNWFPPYLCNSMEIPVSRIVGLCGCVISVFLINSAALFL